MEETNGKSRYEMRGVSASKSEVHHAIRDLSKGLYPTAFCKILPDILGQDEDYVNIMHADTAGTKTSLAYLYWKETGDISVWKGVAQDALVMNLDDMACVGCVDNILVSSTIGRNKHLIPGEVLEQIISFLPEFSRQMEAFGIRMHNTGGETADVGDVVRTIDIGFTTIGRLKKDQLIINDIQAGNVIVGFASSGMANYESEYNSGISSNGLSSAKHDVLSTFYSENYPESFDPNTDKGYVFTGSKKLSDRIIVADKEINIGKLLLSPTRTYMPLLKVMLERYFKDIKGLIHCTGGGQTKVLKFIENKKVVKNNLLSIPDLFRMIKEESGATMREMYQVFNMGHRLELYTHADIAGQFISLAKEFNIEAQIIGYVEEAPKNQVVIINDEEEISFE